ncbi:MAG: ABC transporter permease [Lachnospiraceae bacterium]
MLVNEPLFLAGPVDTLQCLIRLLVQNHTYSIILQTMSKIMSGFLVSLFLANIFALLSWRCPVIRDGLGPLLLFMKSVPIASIIILCLAWFSSAKISIFIAGFVAFPMMYFEVLSALNGIDVGILEMLKVFRVTPWKQFRYVYLPVLCDRMAEFAKVAVGMCIRAGVAAELIGVPSHSLGEMLYKSKIYLEITDLFAWTFIIVTAGYICERVMIYLIRGLDRLVVGRNTAGGQKYETR